MFIESAKIFFLNVDVGSEITDIVKRTIFDIRKKERKIKYDCR